LVYYDNRRIEGREEKGRRAEGEKSVRARTGEREREREKTRGHVSNISLDSGPEYRGMHREGRCLERVGVYYSPRFLCPLSPSLVLSHSFSLSFSLFLSFAVLFSLLCFSPVKLSAKFNPMQSFSFFSSSKFHL